jgi:hypothetical protein
MRRKLPKREYVFIMSLMYHGFRFSYKRRDLKLNRGYLIPATDFEDSDGIDFWVKMPKDMRLFPIQVTQRGISLFKKHYKFPKGSEKTPEVMDRYVSELAKFSEESHKRIRAKQRWCRKSGIAFVLVRDFDGGITNPNIAWGDIKALSYAVRFISKKPVRNFKSRR